MGRTSSLLTLLLALMTANAFLIPAESAVVLTDTGEIRETYRRGKYAGRQTLQRTVSLANEQATYKLRYYTCLEPLDKSHQVERPQGWKPGHGVGFLGMSPPGQNWYAGGFVNVRVNGEDLEYYLAEFELYPQAGAFSMTFHQPEANVRLIFKLREGDDKLLLRCEIEPREPINSIETILLAYPAAFYSPRDRALLTPQGDFSSNEAPEGQRGNLVELDPGRTTWLMPYDRLLDVARVPDVSDGPCMVTMVPAELSGVAADVREYEEFFFLHYPPTTRAFHLAFQHFRGWTNSRAAAYMKNHGDAFSRELAGLGSGDFLNAPAVANLPPSPDPERPVYQPTAAEQARGRVVSRAVPFEPVRPGDTPRPSRVGGTLTALAAPGEYEPVSLVLYGLRDLEGVGISPSPLRSAAGEIIPRRALDVRALRTVGDLTPHSILVKDTRQELSGTRSAPASHVNAVLDLKQGQSCQVWCTVHVPAEAAPGHYTGSLRVTTPRGQRVEVPLEVEVVPLSLPDPPQVRGVYFRPHLGGAESLRHWRMSEEELRQVLLDLVQHGINAAGLIDAPEANPLRWQLGAGGGWTCDLVQNSEQAHSGEWVAVLTTNEQEGHASLQRRAGPVSAGKEYTFTGWLHGQGPARVWLQWYDEQGKYLSTSGGNFAATQEWQQVSTTAEAPEGAVSVGVRPGVTGQGSEIYWDDLSLTSADGGENLLAHGGFEPDAQGPDYSTVRASLALRREAGLTRQAMSMAWGGTGDQFGGGEAVAGMLEVSQEAGVPFIFYAWDEPAPNHFPQVLKRCAALSSGGGQSAAAIGFPKQDFEELAGHLSIPIFAIEWGYKGQYQEATRWWHEAGHQVYYYWQIWEDPLLQNRLWSGLYLYTGNYDGYYAYAHSDYHDDPFSDDDGKYDAFVAIPTAGEPLATLRWEAMREGTDDLRYVYAVKQKIDTLQERDVQAAEELQARLDEVLEPFGHGSFVTQSPADFQAARRQLAALALGQE